MMMSWMRKPRTLGLSLGATLMVSVFGCGGQGSDSSDAVVVPDSTVSSSSAGKTSAASSPASSASLCRNPVGQHADGRAGQGRGLRHTQGPGQLRR